MVSGRPRVAGVDPVVVVEAECASGGQGVYEALVLFWQARDEALRQVHLKADTKFDKRVHKTIQAQRQRDDKRLLDRQNQVRLLLFCCVLTMSRATVSAGPVRFFKNLRSPCDRFSAGRCSGSDGLLRHSSLVLFHL